MSFPKRSLQAYNAHPNTRGGRRPNRTPNKCSGGGGRQRTLVLITKCLWGRRRMQNIVGPMASSQTIIDCLWARGAPTTRHMNGPSPRHTTPHDNRILMARARFAWARSPATNDASVAPSTTQGALGEHRRPTMKHIAQPCAAFSARVGILTCTYTHKLQRRRWPIEASVADGGALPQPRHIPARSKALVAPRSGRRFVLTTASRSTLDCLFGNLASNDTFLWNKSTPKEQHLSARTLCHKSCAPRHRHHKLQQNKLPRTLRCALQGIHPPRRMRLC